MKFLKLLFNKTFIIVIACLVQIGIMMAVGIFLAEYYYQFWVFSFLISFFLFLVVVNGNDTPETKMLWLTIILPLPFWGIIMYFTFAGRRVPKRHVRKINKTLVEMNEFLPAPNVDETKRILGENYGLSAYLSTYAKTRGNANSKTTYFNSGESWFEDLYKEIENAKSFIFMEFFIISYGKTWDKIHELLIEKVKNGVEVRVVYDDLGTLGKVSPRYHKKLQKEGIECVKFNPIYPIFSSIYNNRDHRKIVVIDGKIGYTGGANIGDEYANEVKRFGHWKDAVIKVEGEGVNELTRLFIASFDGKTKRQSDYAKYFPQNVEKYENGEYVHFFGDGPKPYDNENIGENNFVNIITSAKKYVYITTPYLIISHNLFTALKNASSRGVDVRIVTPSIPDKKIIFYCTRSNYKMLLDAGVKIYEYRPGFIHSKLMVADDKVAFVGTINMDFRSLLHHFECGMDIIGGNTVLEIKNDIENVIEKSEDKKDFRMNKFVSLLCSALRIFFPLL